MRYDNAVIQSEIAKAQTEINSLRAQLAAAEAKAQTLSDGYLDASYRAQQAEAERDRAVKDAERYRWLRTESGNDISAPFVCGVHGAPMGDAGWLTGKHLDAAIDAAIATAAGEAESATARC